LQRAFQVIKPTEKKAYSTEILEKILVKLKLNAECMSNISERHTYFLNQMVDLAKELLLIHPKLRDIFLETAAECGKMNVFKLSELYLKVMNDPDNNSTEEVKEAAHRLNVSLDSFIRCKIFQNRKKSNP
jgi:hypothetical protein